MNELTRDGLDSRIGDLNEQSSLFRKWLDREYEVKQIPSPFIQSIVFTWILFLTFKQITIPIAVSLLLVIGYLIKVRRSSKQ